MCLKNVDLNLTFNGKEFVGKGYKSYHIEDIRNLGRGKWIQAKGCGFASAFKTSRSRLKNIVNSSGLEKYFPGFHIFLEYEDALSYNAASKNSAYNSTRQLVKVKYKGVTGFGTNKAGYSGYKPCVIALFMKIEKVYSIKETQDMAKEKL